ncbi:ribonuclease P protein component [Patescibacteria group bacterium]|nr:ribonuclease P protein component [Patescibacteria group bacterium]
MLKIENRLKKQKDFKNVFKNGKGFKQGSLYLKVQKNDLKSTRFGFIVSKKFSKKAVERNRAKRVLREIIKIKLPRIKTGLDIVILVNPETEIDFEKLQRTIKNLFKKAGLIQG